MMNFDLEKLIVANVYVPCDPTIALEFMEKVYDKLCEIMDRHEDAFLILVGDFNACFRADIDSNKRAFMLLLVKCYDKKWLSCQVVPFIGASTCS